MKRSSSFTSNSNAVSIVRPAVRLTAKLLIVLAPFLAVFLFSFIALSLSGELSPVDAVIQEQAKGTRPVLFGLAYSDPDLYYKLKSVLVRKPEIISLGTSRSVQFRASFFKNASFFNAGRGIVKVRHLRDFLNHIPAGMEPKVILIGLDQNFFNPAWDATLADNIDPRYAKAESGFDIFVNGWNGVYKDYLKGKFSLLRLFQREAHEKKVGLSAIANNNGFRNDGKYLYGKYVAHPDDPANDDYQFRDTFAKIATGDNRFAFCSEGASVLFRQLDAFLEECVRRHIYVVAFLPPYAHAVYEKLQMSPRHRCLLDLSSTLSPMFQARGFGFYDFSDLAVLGATDRETIDGFHGSEKAYLRLFIEMAKKNRVLARYTDLPFLQKKLSDCKSDYEVFTD